MLNNVTLIGRLTRKPELRYTAAGAAVANFSLAVARPYRSAEGEREVDFIDIATWRQLAETYAEHLDKGRLVAVVGRLQIRAYETQDGQRRKAAEVVAQSVRFLDSPKHAEDGGQGEDPFAPGMPKAASPADEDDVPF